MRVLGVFKTLPKLCDPTNRTNMICNMTDMNEKRYKFMNIFCTVFLSDFFSLMKWGWVDDQEQ